MAVATVAHRHRWFGEAEMTGELACSDCGKTISQYEREHDEMAAFVASFTSLDTDTMSESDCRYEMADAIDQAQTIEAKL